MNISKQTENHEYKANRQKIMNISKQTENPEYKQTDRKS